jgi:preprotein translocase subunit SecY
MATAAEKMFSNVNLGVIGKAEDLKKRLFFVLGALIVYRLGTYIPLPGVDSRVISQMLTQHSGGLLDIFNMFSGGALGRMTIFALNVMPYITVSIVMQLLTVMIPAFAAMKKEGEAGRRKINQYTRYGTVVMAAIQGFSIATYLESLNLQGQFAVINPGMFFKMTAVVSLVGGTLFLMWLGEQINSRGIGNGISLIIFAGIVANLPNAIAKTFELGRTGALSTAFIIIIFAIAIALLFFIVFMERAHRRLIVQYPKRVMSGGRAVSAAESSHLPLKLNTSGVLPPIFASSLLLFPATIAGFSGAENPDGIIQMIATHLAHGKPLYIALFVAMIFFFCYFYMNNVFNPTETADNLRKNGGFIPGIRPGKNTADYITYIMNRITLIGASYIALVCVIPEILIAQHSLPFYLGGTSLLIVVNVTLDTFAQIQAHLIAHQYEGLIKKNKLRTTTRTRR